MKQTLSYSIDGFRQQLSDTLAELRDQVSGGIEHGFDEEQLIDTVNSLICQSNAFNCIHVPQIQGFSPMSEVEVELLEGGGVA